MLANPVFTGWEDKHSAVWGQTPVCLTHRLDRHELFANDTLAAVLEAYPREHYQLLQWGDHGERGSWREGEIGKLSGPEILAAIAKGRVWLNLRNLPQVDKRYGELLEQIFDELAERMPGFDTFTRKIGLLISSPKSRTLYHADLPGQSLWQIRGSKRVYVYPAAAPFMRPEHMEAIALSGVETNMAYQPWYDEHAQVFDLQPGQMLTWPLNAPHRVDNHDCLNVSMTLEYFTPDIRRHHMVTVANGIMRSKLGIRPSSHVTTGPSFWSKAVLQKVLKQTANGDRKRARRQPEFRLDPGAPEAIADIRAA